jgi:hypothetical protein
MPISIKKTKKMFPPDSPLFSINSINSDRFTEWTERYGKFPYNGTIFYKGPLLAISQKK